MPGFRDRKSNLMEIALQNDWKKQFEVILAPGEPVKKYVSALLALLPRHDMMWQAVYGLGLAVSELATQHTEDARTIMRRLMWSLNEESGNLGWGIPEAMGCILSKSPTLAKEYSRIFLSYGYQTGKDDNFIDHAPLRRGVYWGIGILAQGNISAALPALPHIIAAIESIIDSEAHENDRNKNSHDTANNEHDRNTSDTASIIGMAAFALGELAEGIRKDNDEKRDDALWERALRALQTLQGERMENLRNDSVELFDGQQIVVTTVAELVDRAAQSVEKYAN